MAPLFDDYLIVDWSAANQPARGRDSIWIAAARRRARQIELNAPENPPTRAEAIDRIAAAMSEALAGGRRAFIGFDFPFAYPAGATRDLTGEDGWEALWRFISSRIEDGPDNRSNRFDVAAAANRTRFVAPRYWGRPHQRAIDGLPARRPPAAAFGGREFRRVERWRPPAKSVWQLAYNGAAGSQALLGIARLEKLKRAFPGAIAVWPFDTTFAAHLDSPIVLAEIYPSAFAVEAGSGEVKDAAQVRTLAAHFAGLDARGRFAPLLARPPALGDEDAAAVIAEEGWIVGVSEPARQGQ